jgi:hypothetical protein
VCHERVVLWVEVDAQTLLLRHQCVLTHAAILLHLVCCGTADKQHRVG